MVQTVKKKLNKIFRKTSLFVEKNTTRILAMLGIFIILEISKTFPYINLIPNVDFIIVGFTLFLTVAVFRVSVPNKSLILVALLLIFISVIVTIIELQDITEMIGFIIFVLISIMIVRQILFERKELKEIDNPKK